MSEADVVERPEATAVGAADQQRAQARPNPEAPPAAQVADALAAQAGAQKEPPKVFARGEFRYPALGDGKPGGGESVTLLTTGGVPVSGCWQDDGRYVAWSPQPLRDRAKEQRLREMGVRI